MTLSFRKKAYRPLSWSSVRKAAMEPTPSPFRPKYAPSPLYSVPLPSPALDHTAQAPPTQKCLIHASLLAALKPTFYTCLTFTLERSFVFLHIYFYWLICRLIDWSIDGLISDLVLSMGPWISVTNSTRLSQESYLCGQHSLNLNTEISLFITNFAEIFKWRLSEKRRKKEKKRLCMRENSLE